MLPPVPEPLIVLAAPDSRAPLLCAMLGEHPAAYAVPPLNLFVADRLEELRDRLPASGLHGLLRAIAQLHTGEQTLESLETARRWLWRRARRDTAAVHLELRRGIAPRRLIEHSPLHDGSQYPEALDRLARALPDARYLHLVRHPLHQGLHCLRSPLALARLHARAAIADADGERLPDPQLDWYRQQTAILTFLRAIPDERQFRLRIEDLIADSRIQLARICAWLKLDWSREIHQRMLHPERSSYSGPGPYGAHTEIAFEPVVFPPPPDEASATLDGPLPWRPDGAAFRSEVVDLARLLGYA